jgi:hypothetical protein
MPIVDELVTIKLGVLEQAHETYEAFREGILKFSRSKSKRLKELL